MLGTGLQFGRGYGEDRFYNSVKARRNHYHHQNQNQNQQQQQQQEQLQRSRNNGAVSPSMKGKGVISDNRELENRAEHSKPMAMPASKPITPPLSNLDQFLESTTPSVPAQYLSKTRMKGWQTCNVEFQPYFTLGDLWESFKEWSAYGAGVPIVLNGSDGVIQYYVPYLSGIQIYGESTSSPDKSRRPGEESDSDFSKDSSSDGSSDCELERGLRCSREQWNCHHLRSEAVLGLNTLSLGDKHIALQEDFSSDEGEPGNSRGSLLFEFFEQNPPYSREPLADKISDLACRFPKLKTLRSCDLLSTSWISVAWYPIYRIPTGPTLRDLDACFLTFHSLSTPMKVGAEGPPVTFPDGVDGIPRISLPVFGLASYKCKGSMWIPNGGCERQLTTSLLQAADKWLRQLHVNHPDFRFFVSNGTYRRMLQVIWELPLEAKLAG